MKKDMHKGIIRKSRKYFSKVTEIKIVNSGLGYRKYKHVWEGFWNVREIKQLLRLREKGQYWNVRKIGQLYERQGNRTIIITSEK